MLSGMMVVEKLRSSSEVLLSNSTLVRTQLIFLSVLTTISWIGVALTPLLLDHPIVLVGFSPRLVFLTIAAPVTSLPMFLLVGTFRLCVADPVNFSVGKVLGPKVHERMKRRKRVPEWLTARLSQTRLFRKYAMGALIFFRPTGITMNIAGANGVSGKQASVLALAGTMVYLFTLHAGVGYIA